MTPEAARKVARFLQREEGERAPEHADTVCVCVVHVYLCVLLEDNLYVCARGFF